MNTLKENVRVDKYDIVSVLSNLLGFNKEKGDLEQENLDEENFVDENIGLNEALEVPDESDESNESDESGESGEVVDDNYDGIDERYDKQSECSLDLNEDDLQEDDLKEDDPDLKGKEKEKEIEMIIESDDENSGDSSFY